MMASEVKPSGRVAEQKAATVHLTRRVLVLLWFLAVVPWVLVGMLWVQSRPATPKKNGTNGYYGSNIKLTGRCQPGPWGDLDYTRIILEPPDEYMDLSETVAAESRWFFKGQSRPNVEQYLESIGMTAQQRADGLWEQSVQGVVFKPSPAVVFGLTPEARARLYGYLAECEENFAQANAYRFHSDKVDEWFGATDLRPETVRLVRHYLYRQGTSLAFADRNMVFPKLPDDEERRRLLKVLSRRAALRVRLSVTRDSDITALTSYWSIGGRSKDIEPMLESLARLPGGTSIDIAHLLPRFVRIHLYTYPNPVMVPVAAPLNCHWSSLNFFRSTFDDSFATVEGATKGFLENYYEIVGTPRLGDILLFTLPSGGSIHSCVYVADDIVFTKNGISLSAPWILMSLEDVKAYYTSSTDLKIRVLRPKERLG